MSEPLNVLRKHLPSLDAAAIPTKSEVFVLCGHEAREMHDAIEALIAAAPSEPPKLSGEVGEEEHGRTAMIAEMVRSYAHTDPDPSRAHYARKAADALLSQARLLEERTRERDEAMEVWPEWALDIKGQLEACGVEFDPHDEIHLPGALSDWINGFEFECNRRAEAAERLWAWLGERRNLELSFAYDEERIREEDGEWQVHRVSGGRSDLEWELVGAGATPLDAVQAAFEALAKAKPAAGQGAKGLPVDGAQ